MKNGLKNLFVICLIGNGQGIILIYIFLDRKRQSMLRDLKETQSFTNVNSAEKIRPRVKMNYSSVSPTLLLSCRKLQLHSVTPPYLNLAQYHLTIYDRWKKKTLLFGQPPLFPLQIIVEQDNDVLEQRNIFGKNSRNINNFQRYRFYFQSHG